MATSTGPQPDLLWEEFDPGRQVGWHVRCYGKVTSTMDVAWRLAREGAGHGTAVVALDQTQGRGRSGREWVSRPGDSLTMSVLLRPPASAAPSLSLTAGLAVVWAIGELSGAKATIKWPNDVRIDGRKVAGILTEAEVDTEGRSAVVIGIGLNLKLDTSAYEDIREIATSLEAATGRDATAPASASAVLDALDKAYAQVTAGVHMVARWREALDMLGSKVTVRSGEEEVTGVAEDVAPDGSLVVRLDDGGTREVSAGEITRESSAME